MNGVPPKPPVNRMFIYIVILMVVLAVIGFIVFPRGEGIKKKDEIIEEHAPRLIWGEVYAFNEEGYEPSIASDSEGVLFYTAHKNVDRGYQDRINTWGNQFASWFFYSLDNGETWSVPSEPDPYGEGWKYVLGDEGDIGVDARDYVYYCDTTLLDINFHVFANQGEWQYSNVVQKASKELDDRPWIAAQGDGVVHYLGNNAVTFPGHAGRYIYYRSTNGAQRFTIQQDIPGNGWLHMDTERFGDHAYIVKETTTGSPADIVIHITDDQGASWNWNDPIYIGSRDGPGGPPGEGSRWPVVAAGENGTVWVMWGDYEDSVDNGTRLFLARSRDYGQTWNSTEITPFQGLHDYFWVSAGPNGSVGISFYSSTALPMEDSSEWFIYGGVLPNADEMPIDEIVINCTKADPTPVYAGTDYHALHDFREDCFTPDGAFNIAYQYFVGPGNGDSDLYYVRGELCEGTCEGEEEGEE